MSSNIDQLHQSSHISGGSAAFVEQMYEDYLHDPSAVSADWRKYFDGLQGREAGDVAHSPIVQGFVEQAKRGRIGAATSSASDENSQKQAVVLKLVTAFRSRGHLAAQIDPLGMMPKQEAPDLEPQFHGLTASDMNVEFNTSSTTGPNRLKLKDLEIWLRATYTSSIGAEYMHISDMQQRRWIGERIEAAGGKFGFDADKRKRLLQRLSAAEGLERYLHTKYVGQKRFSLEGGDSLIPMMDEMVQRAGSQGVKDIVIGMAHRGRLNLLVNLFGKDPQELFAEFEGKHHEVDDPAHTGDVKYHMGYSSDVKTPGGVVHLALGFNPSHLEIINPVVAGSVRSRQTRRQDKAREQVLPILIHGDAAFAGQGVGMELLNMSQARGFAVGGTIHIVINNQVGFTTHRPDDARSTLYCTDVAKIVGAPVFHVNGDDPEAVLFCTQMAVDYRKQFKRDVVIDLVCYRRHGHNEADEPAATQPLMYKVIRARKTTRELYAEKLAQESVLSAEDAKALVDDFRARLDAGKPVAEVTHAVNSELTIDWSKYLKDKLSTPTKTNLADKKIKQLAELICHVPKDAALHPRVAKVMTDRNSMAAGKLALDWGFAENLAYASLLDEGFRLRLVGQDAGRGTFFHRHAVLHDQNTGEAHIALRNVSKNPDVVTIIDSLLSEEAVMAFEYGYSTTDPNTLVIWEGQFGDFCNGAQVVIDQFISSGEAKWGRLCGLTLFLPHGYEGQGPEHSSARLERFLQLCALNNMQVCVPTTPAQMFHMLRRQMVRKLRKPLIVMTPKSMLRHKLSVSTLDDLKKGQFQTMIPDSFAKDPKKVKRLVLCSGKVYYDLLEDAQTRKLKNVAIVRVEQLYPFPRDEVRKEIARFSGAKDVIWCQEEPMNQGAWFQIRHHLQDCITSKNQLHYAGRPGSPAPAGGHFSNHVAEQARLVEQALVLAPNGTIATD